MEYDMELKQLLQMKEMLKWIRHYFATTPLSFVTPERIVEIIDFAGEKYIDGYSSEMLELPSPEQHNLNEAKR